MKDTLIFFSERYPFEYIGGVYEEREIKEFEKHFKQIIIISSCKKNITDSKFFIPRNLIFKSFDTELKFIEKLWAFRLIFTADFYKEFRYIKKTLELNLNFRIFIIALIEMQKARKLYHLTRKLISQHPLNPSETVIYSFWNDFRAYASVLLARQLQHAKAISRTHGGDIYFERHPFNYLPFKGILYRELNGIFPISNSSADYLKEKLDVKNDKIKSYHLGISNPYAFQQPKFNETLNIVSCSHIVKIKRVELIAQGLIEIKDFPFNWFHIGGDYMGGKVDEFCKNHFNNVSQKYSLLGSWSNDQILDFYKSKSIDLFINLSESEGIPVSIMEAMSFGIPVIATNVGSTSEIVIDGITGFLLPSNPSLTEIAEVISRFYHLSREEKYKMSLNSYNYWKSEFNAEVNYPKFVEMVIDL